MDAEAQARPEEAPLGPYLAMVLVLSLPFWGLAAFAQAEPLPGLPLSALMTVVPAAAALILSGRAAGGRRRLLARALDLRRLSRAPPWAPLVLVKPAIATGVWLAAGRPAPPDATALLLLAPMVLVFVAAAVGEELGWSGYATDPLAARWGPLRAGVALGVIWAAWHVVPFLQADRTWDWIAWHGAATVALRVIIVRLYVATGRSVFAAVLLHAFSNVADFGQPLFGAAYDPRASAVALWAVAGVIWSRRSPN